MTVSYEQAVRRIRATLDVGSAWKVYSSEPGTNYREDLCALLSGPPEPTEDEVAMAWLDRSMPLPLGDSALNVACRALIIPAAQRVLTLFRSRRNDR